MLWIAVCDDNPIECAELAERVRNTLSALDIPCTVKRFFGSDELLCCNECFDMAFLDIKMPGTSGISLAKNIRIQGRKTIVIFVTSAEEYVFDAYDVEAFHYLLKPVGDEKLKTVLRKAAVKIQDGTREDFLIVSADRQTKKILLKDIIYIESLGRIAEIHCKNESVSIYKNIGDLEQALLGKGFFRCHKSFLINLEYVSRFDKTQIIMENGDSVFLARKRSEPFQKAVIGFMKRKGGIM